MSIIKVTSIKGFIMKILVINRNIIMSIFAVMLLIYSVQGISYAQEGPDTTVEFSDVNLARIVREALDLPTGDGVDLLKIPKAELEKLTTLDADNREINDLTGLEHASQLTELNLRANQISDITPLAQLTQLTKLNLYENQIRDVTPLAGLISLERLYLENNPIESKSPLFALLDVNPDVYIDISLYDYLEGPWLWMIAPGGNIHSDNLSETSKGVITETQIAQNGVSEGEHFGFLQWTSGRLHPTIVCGIFLCSSDNVINVVREIGLTDKVQLHGYSAYALININSPHAQNSVQMGVGSDDSIKVWLNGSVVHSNNSKRRTTGIQDKFRVNLNAGDNLLLVKICNYSPNPNWTFFDSVENNDWGMFFKIYLNPENYTVFLPTDQPELTPTPSENTIVQIRPASVASPGIGNPLEISLNITGGESVAGYQATVQFDTTALRYVSSANGDYLPADAFFVPPKVEGNLVQLNAASLAGESNGDGTLATLTFEVIAAKASTLTLSDVLLINSDGETFVPTVENAEITESTQLKGDINGDGIVNIQDLVLVAGRLGQTGTNSADVNEDNVVNIQDLVLVAGALGNSAAAPSPLTQSLETFTAADAKQWLSQVQQLNLTDATSKRGILFLQQLLIALTPKETVLLANYPNPFNPETWIPYHLANPSNVRITIYNARGTVVRRLELGHQQSGYYISRSRAAYWDGTNSVGERVASGIYFYQLEADNTSFLRKMVILK